MSDVPEDLESLSEQEWRKLVVSFHRATTGRIDVLHQEAEAGKARVQLLELRHDHIAAKLERNNEMTERIEANTRQIKDFVDTSGAAIKLLAMLGRLFRFLVFYVVAPVAALFGVWHGSKLAEWLHEISTK
jgi:predicted PurR-regulated permease PerM